MATDAQACIFCRIASGELGVRLLHDDHEIIAFADVNPQAPVHVLVIPRRHVVGLSATSPDDEAWLGRLMSVARDLAQRLGIAESGYRTVINTGADAGQSVPHLHAHLLGGRHFDWPPG